MPVVSIDELGAAPQGPLLGLDLGEKTIGIAVSDVSGTVASPLAALRQGKFTAVAGAVAAAAAERAAVGVVVGLPVSMDGTEGPRAQSARQFAANLAGRLALPVALWDERLSTAAVERALIQSDVSRRRRAALVDKLAAAYILQGALDYLSNRRRAAVPDS
jgi:putative Holliday junction resolvase